MATETAHPVGLIAGAGRFPIAFAEKAKQLGIPVVCVGIRYEAPLEIRGLVSCFYWSGIARLGRMISCFKREGVTRVVMAGKVHKDRYMYRPWRMLSLCPDLRMLRFWFNRARRDNRDDSVLLNLISEFESDGMKFYSALDFCPELLVRSGILTKRPPTDQEQRDINLGWDLAKEMGRLDVGQSVAVKERAVLAVEAIEGTDKAIARAGDLCPRGGFVVVKVAKPSQDMRFDVPTIGTATIETMHRSGGRVLAIESGKTIILDEAQTVSLADRYRISIVAIP